MKNNMSAKIKKFRLEMGYSLNELSEITKISKSYLWELENKPTRKPSVEKLSKIAETFNVTVDYLASESETDLALYVAQKRALFLKFYKLNKREKKIIGLILDAFIEDKNKEVK